MRFRFRQLIHDEREQVAVTRAIADGHWAGNGLVGRRTEARLTEILGAGTALLTTSCTHALEMAFVVAGVEAGDEVILPNFAFVSCANAIVQMGARPIFADVEPQTLSLDPASLREHITHKTRAVLAIDYAGLPAQHAAISKLSREHDLKYIEDAAHGIGATLNGQALGTLGDIGCLSFHATKNISCGEGGALIVSNPKQLALAEQVREKGTDRARFLAGEVDKYTWRTRGSSYVLSDILASILEIQLSRLELITSRRRAVFERYLQRLSPHASLGFSLPVVPEGARVNGHIFWLLVDGGETRRALFLSRLKEAGVESTFHYQPLNRSVFATSNDLFRARLPVSERAAESILLLPIHAQLELSQVDEICDIVIDIARAT